MFDLPFEGFLGVPDNCPTTAEIKKAVSSMRAKSSPGEDGIGALALQQGGPRLLELLHVLVSKIWAKEAIPEDWRTSLIVPLFKKGELT